MTAKLAWSGRLTSVQPRIRLLRSFDQVQHAYPGYVLCVEGRLDDREGAYTQAIGAGAQAKHALRVGDRVRGRCAPVEHPEKETASFYKVSGLALLERPALEWTPPPWLGCPPDLPTYRARGHRRLDPRTYEASCSACIWGCRMPVEMVIDQWNPSQVQHRRETFCYGPKSCPRYRAGATRKVPGRRGMVYEEEDWVDEENTAHRGPDE